MTIADERLRPPPSVREAGPELPLDLVAKLRALRAEAHPPTQGHRQIAWRIAAPSAGPLRVRGRQSVLLDPDVPHDGEAMIESDRLLTVHLLDAR